MKRIRILGVLAVISLTAACTNASAVGTGKVVSTSSTAAAASSHASTTTAQASTTTTQAKPKGIYAMGTTISTPVTLDGIVTATVYGFYPKIQSSQPDIDTPPAGKTYGAIEAQECAATQRF